MKRESPTHNWLGNIGQQFSKIVIEKHNCKPGLFWIIMKYISVQLQQTNQSVLKNNDSHRREIPGTLSTIICSKIPEPESKQTQLN